jgi:oligoribonuclease
VQDAKNLVWIDLEMTGLDPEKDSVLQIATVVTDSELGIVAEGPVIEIRHSLEELERMDPWCVQHHAASGLARRCAESRFTVGEAEALTLEFVRRYCPEGRAPLCGNSVHQDRRFLARYMPRLNAYFHYRIIDVSSVKELVQRWYPREPGVAKRKTHLALEDIRDSIQELAEYRKRYFKP